MEISNLKTSPLINFASRKLFAATLCKKTAEGIKKPVQAFVSELSAMDIGRGDLTFSRWGRTKYGKDILRDFYDVYSPQLFDEYTTILPTGGEYRFFATEAHTQNAKKAVSIAEVRILDDFMVVDRLQTLVKSKKAQKRVEGAGSSLLYAVVALAKKLKKQIVSLEADEKVVGFYKKVGFSPNDPQRISYQGNYLRTRFYRLYQPQYENFLAKIGKKLGMVPVE